MRHNVWRYVFIHDSTPLPLKHSSLHRESKSLKKFFRNYSTEQHVHNYNIYVFQTFDYEFRIDEK